MKKTENTKTFHELAADLACLGLTEVSDEVLTSCEKGWDEMPAEFRENTEKLPMLLSYMGSGDYNYDTWEWTPTSDCIYSFDVEIFNCAKMYTDFFAGIQAISKQEFSITNVTETASDEDYERGTGTVTVQFQYNGTPYTYDARLENDWFDVNMVNYVNQVMKKEKNPKRLYFMSDGYQELIIFYCTSDWANQFRKKTGYTLDSTTKNF